MTSSGKICTDSLLKKLKSVDSEYVKKNYTDLYNLIYDLIPLRNNLDDLLPILIAMYPLFSKPEMDCIFELLSEKEKIDYCTRLILGFKESLKTIELMCLLLKTISLPDRRNILPNYRVEDILLKYNCSFIIAQTLLHNVTEPIKNKKVFIKQFQLSWDQKHYNECHELISLNPNLPRQLLQNNIPVEVKIWLVKLSDDLMSEFLPKIFQGFVMPINKNNQNKYYDIFYQLFQDSSVPQYIKDEACKNNREVRKYFHQFWNKS